MNKGNRLSRLSTPLKLSRDDNGEPFRRDYHRNTVETPHHHSLPIQVPPSTDGSMRSQE
ncbi:unnamed protein product [Camellia sinensis]